MQIYWDVSEIYWDILQGHYKFSPESVIKKPNQIACGSTNGSTCYLMLRSQIWSYMLSHWCRPQLGFASHAVQEVVCIMWFLITYFQDYSERSCGVLGNHCPQLPSIRTRFGNWHCRAMIATHCPASGCELALPVNDCPLLYSIGMRFGNWHCWAIIAINCSVSGCVWQFGLPDNDCDLAIWIAGQWLRSGNMDCRAMISIWQLALLSNDCPPVGGLLLPPICHGCSLLQPTLARGATCLHPGLDQECQNYSQDYWDSSR